MAVTVDSANLGGSTGATGVTSFTWNHTCASGCKLLLVGVGGTLSANISSITYNSVALSLVGEAEYPNEERVCLYKLTNPNTGSAYQVVVTFISSISWVAVGSISFLGASGTLGTVASAYGLSTSASVNVSSVTNEMVVDVISARRALTVGAGQTSQWYVELNSGQDARAQSTEAGAASVTMSWTLSESFYWVILGVSVQEAVTSQTYSESATEVLALSGVNLSGSAFKKTLSESSILSSILSKITAFYITIKNW